MIYHDHLMPHAYGITNTFYCVQLRRVPLYCGVVVLRRESRYDTVIEAHVVEER